jgi:hypothetical protein
MKKNRSMTFRYVDDLTTIIKPTSYTISSNEREDFLIIKFYTNNILTPSNQLLSTNGQIYTYITYSVSLQDSIGSINIPNTSPQETVELYDIPPTIVINDKRWKLLNITKFPNHYNIATNQYTDQLDYEISLDISDLSGNFSLCTFWMKSV